jgi:hypothetical protein
MSNNNNNGHCGEHPDITIGTIIQLDDKIYKVNESVQIIDRICWREGAKYIDGYVIQLVSLKFVGYNQYSVVHIIS